MGSEIIIGWVVKFLGGILWRHWHVGAVLIGVTVFTMNTAHKIQNRFENRRIAAENFQLGFEEGLSRCRDGGRRKWWQIFRGDTSHNETYLEFESEYFGQEPWFSPLLRFGWSPPEDATGE